MSPSADPAGHFKVRTMTAAEVALALDWAAAEGWNPGRHDAPCFYAADPEGFFIGEWQGEPVACLSAVAYDDSAGFIGLYIVRPEFRGMGLGIRIWRHGMAYLGERNVGLDGVVALQANYRKAGFQLAWRNIRYQGTVQGASLATAPTSTVITPISTLPFEPLLAYDGSHFAAQRPRFLEAWIRQPETVALAAVQGGRICGYGVARHCQSGYKIGPLFADDALIADNLLRDIAARLPEQSVITLDVPETHPAAVDLAERHGMARVFETARMYTKGAPALPMPHIFGVTSFEL
ncbi:MAG TPA: GNAT family N-acetyltransferase, partial [Paraburkholderia sp.]|nr:GNAT family N-acetyltransferase [Paraburkholderia sp.]